MKISKKQILLKTVLPELLQQHPYIAFARIKQVAQSAKLIDSIPTLKERLGDRKKTPEEVLSKESTDYLGIS